MLKRNEDFEIKCKINYPQCWADDERMSVLFAPFRPRDVNPEHYSAKLNFWKNLISEYCKQKGSCEFCINELKEVFRRKDKVPHGIKTVIENMLSTKEIDLKTDLDFNANESWRSWAMAKFVLRSISRRIVELFNSNGFDENTEYIHLGVLEEQSQKLEKDIRILSNQLFSIQKLRQELKPNLNEQGILMCLQYLNNLRKIYIDYNGERKDKILIKVPAQGKITNPPTEIDKSIYYLHEAKNDVTNEIRKLEEELQYTSEQVRNLFKCNKSTVKTLLKTQYELKVKLEKKTVVLNNINELLRSIQETQLNDTILSAYTIGCKTLKAQLSKSNLDLSKVDDVLFELREVFERKDEVERTISSVLEESIDESVLEKELQDLLEAEEEIMNKNKDTANLFLQSNVDSNEAGITSQLKKLEVVDNYEENSNRSNKKIIIS